MFLYFSFAFYWSHFVRNFSYPFDLFVIATARIFGFPFFLLTLFPSYDTIVLRFSINNCDFSRQEFTDLVGKVLVPAQTR